MTPPLGLDEVAAFDVRLLLIQTGELAGVETLAALEFFETEALGPEGGLFFGCDVALVRG